MSCIDQRGQGRLLQTTAMDALSHFQLEQFQEHQRFRAMRRSYELETEKTEAYTPRSNHLSATGDMDLPLPSIMILKNQIAYVQAGAGIV